MMHHINFDEDKIVSCVQIKAVCKAIECPVSNNPVFLMSGNKGVYLPLAPVPGSEPHYSCLAADCPLCRRLPVHTGNTMAMGLCWGPASTQYTPLGTPMHP